MDWFLPPVEHGTSPKQRGRGPRKPQRVPCTQVYLARLVGPTLKNW